MHAPSNQHGRHIGGILREIEGNRALSQRHLADRLGIALGLTNLLLRRAIAKGWVRAVRTRPNRVCYLLTPAGIAAKAKLTRESLQATMRFYSEARARVHQRLNELSIELGAAGATKRIVFFGAGDVAEIGYVSLQETDLQLVALIDRRRTKPFFGIPVHSPDDLQPGAICGCAFDRLVITTFEHDDIAAQLEARGLGADRVFSL